MKISKRKTSTELDGSANKADIDSKNENSSNGKQGTTSMKRSPNLVREKSKKENNYFAEDEDPIRLSIGLKKRSNHEFNIRKKSLKVIISW
jgi:hypothetical protein